MDTDMAFGLAPYEIALLAGGERAAVTVAVVELHLRGTVETGPPGTLCTTGPEPDGLAPFVGAVLDVLREPLTVRELVRDADMRLAVALARLPLADAGLLRYPRLGPNRTARRRVAFLRERYPLPTTPHGLTDTGTLLAVALHGEQALRLLLPRFAVRAGLVAGA
ncbi:TIGR04222 domain-containing membrane protein [Streptomyces sp. NPDC023723]|uniref:TIGR04222 domain-containing membrane protein n=1 Tax=Streptomyces sp. NPDC023723 TaxID=3154323 RepID=UPI0034096F6E